VLGAGTISASSTTSNVSYNWAGPNIVSGGNTASPSVNASGTYTVIVTNPINGCTNTATVLVNTDNTIPDLTATSNLTLSCYDITDTLFANSSISGVSYSWAGPGTIINGSSSSPI
jgi:hypothetical protein